MAYNWGIVKPGLHPGGRESNQQSHQDSGRTGCGMHFLTPEITYGLLGGLVFQGIYCYGDWQVILVSRHQTRAKERPVNTGKNGAPSESGL